MIKKLTPFIFASLLLCSGEALQLRKALGPYDVGVTTFEPTDTSRLDPLAPTPQNRSIELSIHYPTRDTSAPVGVYLPDLTASDLEVGVGLPAGSLHNITTHNHVNASILSGRQSPPVILFSPGIGFTRLAYTTMVQDLASEGYVVISIDHPFDTSIVELSDGRVLRATNPFNTSEAVDTTLHSRVADARFILDTLSHGHPSHIPGLNALNTSRVGFFGHSLGGAAAAATEVLDARVIGGLNFDGAFEGSDVLRGTSKPFVMVLSAEHNSTMDPTLAEVLPKMTGFRREFRVAGAVHVTFTDGPVVSKLLGLDLSEDFGTIPVDSYDAIQHAYLTAYFDFVFEGKKSELLDKASKRFPEVTVAH